MKEFLWYLSFFAPCLVFAFCTASANALTAAVTLTIDTLAPTVSSVFSTALTGSYKAGASLPLVVRFSEPVTVSSFPYLTLNVRGGAAIANYSTGSMSRQLTFVYSVLSGDNVAALEVLSRGALLLDQHAGSYIRDFASNDANRTLPIVGSSSSLSEQTLLIIDTTAPVVLSVYSTNSVGSYQAGQQLQIVVSLSEPVEVHSRPLLWLNTGRAAVYSTGYNTSLLTFLYDIMTGDNVALLSVANASAFEVPPSNGALSRHGVKDVAGNALNVVLPTST